MPIWKQVGEPGLFFSLIGKRVPCLSSLPLMDDFIFPTQSLLSVSSQTAALSATTMSSVISGVPRADAQLNRHSLLSRGFLLRTFFTSAPPVVSPGTQEDTEEHSAISLTSREPWRPLSSSKSPISPAKITVFKQVVILSSSALHTFTTQAFTPSEDQAVTIQARRDSQTSNHRLLIL